MNISFVKLSEKPRVAAIFGASLIAASILWISILPLLRSAFPKWLSVTADFAGTILNFVGVLYAFLAVQAWRLASSSQAETNKPKETWKGGALFVVAGVVVDAGLILLESNLPRGFWEAVSALGLSLVTVGLLYVAAGLLARKR